MKNRNKEDLLQSIRLSSCVLKVLCIFTKDKSNILNMQDSLMLH